MKNGNHFHRLFLSELFVCVFFFGIGCDQPHNNTYCVGQITLFHGIDKFPAILVGVLNGIIQGVAGNLFFFQNGGEALLLKGARV